MKVTFVTDKFALGGALGILTRPPKFPANGGDGDDI